MECIVDEAIVLKLHDYGEADSIVVLLTRNNGKVRAMARGVRRPVFRAVSPVTPFSVVEVKLRPAMEDRLWTVLGTRLVPGGGLDLRDLDGFHLRSYMAEVMLTTEMEPAVARRFFRLFRAVSEAASKGRRLLPLVLYFQLWFLKLEGVLSDPAVCVSCARSFASDRPPAALTHPRAELLCRECLNDAAGPDGFANEANPQAAAPAKFDPAVSPGRREEEIVLLFALYGKIFTAHPAGLEGSIPSQNILRDVTMGLDNRIGEFLLKTCKSFVCIMECVDNK